MPIHYVEDYEELTGLKREAEDAPVAESEASPSVVETKVVGAPETQQPEPVTVAEVK